MIPKSYSFYVLCFMLLITKTTATCNQTNTEDERSVKSFFKNVGCTLERGAKKIGEGVQTSYNYIKDKISPIEDKPTPITTTTEETADVLFDVRLDRTDDSERDKNNLPITTKDPKDIDVETRFLTGTAQNCGQGQAKDLSGNCRD